MKILSAVVDVLLRSEKGFLRHMTKKEAALILGVSVYAGAEEINRRYRNALQCNHPDRGGSKYLAQKVNEARDMLLKK